jgi:hypothetical protein
MSLTYILVDFDNVKPSAADIGLVRGDQFRLAVVRGPQQTRYEADLAEALHEMGPQVTFTRCARAGKNAADMQIAYLLGELVASLPGGGLKGTRFVVISKDRDFDPLLAYLQGRGVEATRAASFKAALHLKGGEPARPAKAAKAAKAAKPAKTAKAAKSSKPEPRPVPAEAPPRKAARKTTVAKKAVHAAPTPLARLIDGLQRKGEERPGKRKGLERFIESHLGRKLAPGQVDALIAELERDGLIAFRDNKVEYLLGKGKK